MFVLDQKLLQMEHFWKKSEDSPLVVPGKRHRSWLQAVILHILVYSFSWGK